MLKDRFFPAEARIGDTAIGCVLLLQLVKIISSVKQYIWDSKYVIPATLSQVCS